MRLFVFFCLLFLLISHNLRGSQLLAKDITYKVESYGIKPDGTPIAKRLQWLSQKVSQDGGGVIKFSEGTYIVGCTGVENGAIENTIRLFPNVKYVGTKTSDGTKQTTLKANLDNVPFYSIFYTGDDNARNIVFCDIIFDTYIGAKYDTYLSLVILFYINLFTEVSQLP